MTALTTITAFVRGVGRHTEPPVATPHRTSRAVAGPTNASEGATLQTIALSWEEWRAVIAVLQEKALPYLLDHADHIERLLEQHGPDEPIVRLSLTDNVFLHSYNRS